MPLIWFLHWIVSSLFLLTTDFLSVTKACLLLLSTSHCLSLASLAELCFVWYFYLLLCRWLTLKKSISKIIKLLLFQELTIGHPYERISILFLSETKWRRTSLNYTDNIFAIRKHLQMLLGQFISVMCHLFSRNTLHGLNVF